MPRLPDYTDVGGRVAPQPSRSVASNPRAGAVAEALAGFGGQIVGAGKDMLEQQDKLEYATAKASLLKADMDARRDLQENDPDFNSWEAKYQERMKSAREAAVGAIQSRGARAMFDIDANNDITSGAARIGEVVGLRQKDARLAGLNQSLDDMQDVGQNATDDSERDKVFGTVGQLIDASVARGDMTAIEGQDRKRKWAAGYGAQYIQALITRDDPEGALAFLDKHRSMFDPDTEARLDSMVIGAKDNRDVLVGAEAVVHGGWGKGETDTAPGAAPSIAGPTGKAAFKAAAKQQESGGNASAGNSKSSASGLYGFTDGTFVDTYRKVYGNGLTREQILAKKNDPATQEKLMDRLTDDNAKALRGIGVAETAGNLYVMHHLGQGDAAKVFKAKSDTPMSEIVSGAVMSANPHMKGKTAGEFISWADKAMGGNGTTQGAAEYDLEEVYARADAYADEHGFSPEKREKLKAQVARTVDRDEGLKRRDESEADEAAQGIVDNLGDGLTSMSQIPADLQARMSPSMKSAISNRIKQNNQPKPVAANGPVDSAVKVLEMENPAVFASLTPAQVEQAAAGMTSAEAQSFRARQRKAVEEWGKWSPHGAAIEAINRGKFMGLDVTKDPHDKMMVYNYVGQRAREWRDSGKVPNDNDYDRWFREATQVTSTGDRAYDVRARNYLDLIVRRIRQERRDPNYQPSQAEIDAAFKRFGEGGL